MKIKNRVDVNNEQKLIQLIKKDYLKRKTHLGNLIQLFSNSSDPIVVGIDGEWGTGKTVFLKQLEILINSNEEIELEDHINLSEFKKENKAFYFNSWENDMYDSPLQSILFSLTKQYQKELIQSGYDMSNIINVGSNLLNLGVKLLSNGAVESDDFKLTKDNSKQLINSIVTVEEIKSEIEKFLNIITEEKKLIIIVDELDRCKPTFAIELLEVIKHYFLHDSVHFILCSNKTELAHTVKRYYGPEFNGNGYLDRFIDFEYILPTPNRVDYLENVLGVKDTDYYYLSHMVVEYFGLTLRQINKYVLSKEVMLNAWYNKRFGTSSEELLFLFYFVGLNTINLEYGKKFINGEGFGSFEEFYKKNEDELSSFLFTKENNLDRLSKMYNSMFIDKEDNKKRKFLNFLTSIN